MKFKLENTEETLEGDIIKVLGNNEFIVKIRDREYHLKILNMTHEKIEFVLDNAYHVVKYIETSTAKISIIVDGVKITFNRHPDLDKIVYKSSGIESGIDAQVLLKSQIPGRVVSINVGAGDKVKKGDVVCVLESMKMQVSIKAHKDGVVKSVKVKQGVSVAKNDTLVEIE